MRILVVNAGSSSLKLSVLDGDDNLLSSENIPNERGRIDADELRRAIEENAPIDAVGHRVVHGGTEFVAPVLVDERVIRRLQELADLAPLHQPKSLHGLELVGRALPGTPAVACFDTAFHAHIPPAAATYALPREWRTRWDLRKFGFHGLSHEWASNRVLDLTGADRASTRIVTCHLGAGASLAAVRDGHSVDTTMGFTPLDGLVMATRSGEVDPGLILWLEEHMGMPPSELASTLEHRSGLLGLTGTADLKAILEREAAGDEQAALAVGVYLHRLRAGIAAMTAALGGLDLLAFTGGVGERSAPIRARAAEGLAFAGVVVDAARNEAPALDAEISADGAATRTFVVAAREDLQIARGVRAVLG